MTPARLFATRWTPSFWIFWECFFWSGRAAKSEKKSPAGRKWPTGADVFQYDYNLHSIIHIYHRTYHAEGQCFFNWWSSSESYKNNINTAASSYEPPCRFLGFRFAKSSWQAKRNGGSELSKPPLEYVDWTHESNLPGNGFFLSPLGGAGCWYVLGDNRKPITTSNYALCVIGSASVRLALW